MPTLDVELLWWEGCPSTAQAREELDQILRELGLDPAGVRMREIRSQSEAERAGFIGSPTILVDGADVVPTDSEPVALTCRVYRRRDGRISPIPDPDDVREALEQALR